MSKDAEFLISKGWKKLCSQQRGMFKVVWWLKDGVTMRQGDIMNLYWQERQNAKIRLKAANCTR
jgi:hypothetical protein